MSRWKDCRINLVKTTRCHERSDDDIRTHKATTKANTRPPISCLSETYLINKPQQKKVCNLLNWLKQSHSPGCVRYHIRVETEILAQSQCVHLCTVYKYATTQQNQLLSKSKGDRKYGNMPFLPYLTQSVIKITLNLAITAQTKPALRVREGMKTPLRKRQN